MRQENAVGRGLLVAAFDFSTAHADEFAGRGTEHGVEGCRRTPWRARVLPHIRGRIRMLTHRYVRGG
jgi:hypothetical protein